LSAEQKIGANHYRSEKEQRNPFDPSYQCVALDHQRQTPQPVGNTLDQIMVEKRHCAFNTTVSLREKH
jgi:hypothetical protein